MKSDSSSVYTGTPPSMFIPDVDPLPRSSEAGARTRMMNQMRKNAILKGNRVSTTRSANGRSCVRRERRRVSNSYL